MVDEMFFETSLIRVLLLRSFLMSENLLGLLQIFSPENGTSFVTASDSKTVIVGGLWRES